MRKIQEEYGTPDFWPESVLEDLGDFIDDMDMSQIAMLDEDNVCKTLLNIIIARPATEHFHCVLYSVCPSVGLSILPFSISWQKHRNNFVF